MDTDINVGTISFLSLNSFNVDDEFLSVDLDDLSDLVSLIMSTNNLKSRFQTILKI